MASKPPTTAIIVEIQNEVEFFIKLTSISNLKIYLFSTFQSTGSTTKLKNEIDGFISCGRVAQLG